MGACAFSGVLSGIFGIGGGFLVVPVLNFLLSVFYESVPNTMAIATTTSMCNICIVNGISSYRRRADLVKLRSTLPWIVCSSAVGGMIGSYLTKIVSDDFLHILFPCFLSLIIVFRTTVSWMKRKPIFQGFVFSEYYYVAILLPCGAICVMCGIGGGIVLFPIMLAIFDNKKNAAAIAGFNSLTISFCSLLVTLFYPSTYTLYPFIYADIFLPLVLCSFIISPFFTKAGSWVNKKLSSDVLDRSLIALTSLIVCWQIMTL